MRMQVILDSLFARPGSAPIGGGKKGEFRDWTTTVVEESQKTPLVRRLYGRRTAPQWSVGIWAVHITVIASSTNILLMKKEKQTKPNQTKSLYLGILL